MLKKLAPIALIFALAFSLTHLASAATVSGYAYDFFTLEPLKNVVVEINTLPPQTMVAKDGFYSLEVPPGNYTLKARAMRDGNVTYSTQENLQVVSGDGDYSFDLLLESEGSFDFEIPDDSEIASPQPTAGAPPATVVPPATPKTVNTATHAIMLAVILIVLGLAYAFYKVSRLQSKVAETARREKGLEKQIAENIEPIEEARTSMDVPGRALSMLSMPVVSEPKLEVSVTKVAARAKVELEKEEQEVVQLLNQNDGRMQQRELRRILKWSEAKLSNVTDDLAEKGVIKKIKRGRGNILRLAGAKEE